MAKTAKLLRLHSTAERDAERHLASARSARSCHEAFSHAVMAHAAEARRVAYGVVIGGPIEDIKPLHGEIDRMLRRSAQCAASQGGLAGLKRHAAKCR